MHRIYLDNAATTAVDAAVLQDMLPYFTEKFGNASAIYSYGRENRLAIEQARKKVAAIIHAQPGEIFFTSCGTESSNTAIQGSIRDLGCKKIITSPIEHHATLHTVEHLVEQKMCEVAYVKLLENGQIDLEHLAQLLSESTVPCLVTLMHANNEIGNLLDIEKVAQICATYGAIFHTDTVQTFGHFEFNMQQYPIHFLSASAHKFHGPKGAGMLYINSTVQIKPHIHGGAQERLMRAGTENVPNIVGFASALTLAMQHFHEDRVYIQSLKDYLREKILQHFPETCINGDEGEQSLYTILNIAFPKNEKTAVLSMQLDIAGICVSGGSACTSGAEGGSHVIKAVYPNRNCVPIRFSFSKHNTFEELDITLATLAACLQ